MGNSITVIVTESNGMTSKFWYSEEAKDASVSFIQECKANGWSVEIEPGV